MPNNKSQFISYLDRDRAGEVEVARANRIFETDPPEVGYLLIIGTHADRPMGEKLDLRPIP